MTLLDFEPEEKKPLKVKPIEQGWQPLPFCGVCIREAEAWQPGGVNARHSADHSPLCRETRR